MDAFDIAQIMANQDPKRPLKLRYGTVSSVGKGGELEVVPDGISGTPIPAVKCCSPSVNDRIVLLTTETEWLAVAVIGGHQGAIDARGSSKIDSLTLKSPLSLASGGTGATASAAARANLSVPGATHANGYWGITRPDGNGNDYLRAPSDGFIPYQSGGNGYLGTSGWPWNEIHGAKIFSNGKDLSTPTLLWEGTLSAGGIIALPSAAKYSLFIVGFNPYGISGIGTKKGGWIMAVGAYDNGSSTTLYVASMTFDGYTLALSKGSAHKMFSEHYANNVYSIYGVI